ncbi:MAG: hypothetical protein M0Z66_09530 [Thermaerobacter sp.]|nr:hypothetical protein [Thermaerobacter sp.]
MAFVASQGVQQGWLSAAVWPYWLASAVLLAAYAVWAVRQAHPIVAVRLMLPSQQAIAMLLVAIVSIETFALIVVVPMYMQQFQGQSALAAGMVLFPQGLTTGLGALLGNALPKRLGARATTVWCHLQLRSLARYQSVLQDFFGL